MKMHQIAIAIGMVLAGCTVSQPRIKPSDTAAVPLKSVPIEAPAAASLDEPGGYTYDY